MPDRVIGFFEIQKSNPGFVVTVMAGGGSVVKIKNLLETFMFGTEAVLFRDDDGMSGADVSETGVEKAENEFPKGGKHRERPVVI